MTSDAIVEITDRARAVVAIGDELEALQVSIRAERQRHQKAMLALTARQSALEDAIVKLSGGQHL